jgi:tetratricopeptide (TPR) repeat protein
MGHTSTRASLAQPPGAPSATTDRAARCAAFRRHIDAGELIEASALVSEWSALAPGDADAAAAQAQLARLCGRYDDAQTWLDRALALAPAHGPVFVEAARLAMAMGAYELALEWFERAHYSMPGDGEDIAWLSQWASLAHAMGRTQISVAVATRWCERAGESAEAWFALGLAHQQAGALDAAREAYERTMALAPDLPMLRNNLSALHYDRGEYDDALRLGKEAIRAQPDHALAWTNLANVLLKLREPALALLAARRAATLAPDFGLAQLALSNAARESQSWDEAFDAIVRAVKTSGADSKIQFSVAMLQLMRGDFDNGWINFEARWQGSPELARMAAFCPELRWNGQPLAGKTLLVWGEQGHGDAIQFIRFLPALIEQVDKAGGKVICCCFPALYALFKRSLAAYEVEVLPSDVPQVPAFDYQIPLASIPLALRVTLQSLAASSAYLIADEAGVTRWRERMNATSARLKVGLAWTGSRTHQRNALRAVPPEAYAQAFAGLADIDWYGLQHEATDDVARMASAGLPVVDHTNEWNSFDDTAALIGSLDIVVTVCTSVAHLAAALGRPTWLLLDLNPHWVWMNERRDSPWYPTITLYRQCEYRDWTAPLQHVRADLEQAAAQAAASHPSPAMLDSPTPAYSRTP